MCIASLAEQLCDEMFLLLSCTTSLVTPRAVSVVIWTGPRCRVGNPKTRSSDVRSRGGSSPVRNWDSGPSACAEVHTKDSLQVSRRYQHRFVDLVVDIELRNLSTLTPNKYHENVSLSSGDNSCSALGSSRQTLSMGTPEAFMSSSTDMV